MAVWVALRPGEHEPDEYRRLAAAVLWRAVHDAERGDAQAAAWLAEAGDWLASFGGVGVPVGCFGRRYGGAGG